MLKKRIIPCLDVQNGRTVKGVNFLSIQDAGDPITMARRYSEEGADELVFLDITATVESRKTMVSFVERVASEITIPFTVGGGISTVEDAVALIRAGADKISVNSAAVRNPLLISKLKHRLGSQCVVLAVDAKWSNGTWYVTTHGGRQITERTVLEWVQEGVQHGAGELLLTSMDADGTKAGFDLQLTQAVCSVVDVPVIASGGAGSIPDFMALFNETTATGGLAASIFHYGEISIPQLKNELKSKNIPLR